MRAQNKGEIILEFERYFKGINFSNCCVGLAINISETLFEKNNISRMRDNWIYKNVLNNKVAEEIKKYFLSCGMKECIEDKGNDATIIFAYVSDKTK